MDDSEDSEMEGIQRSLHVKYTRRKMNRHTTKKVKKTEIIEWL